MDGWAIYQEAVRKNIQERWEGRRLLLRWLDYVSRTHRDGYTMETLERVIRTGAWGKGWVERARRMSDFIDADLDRAEAALTAFVATEEAA